MTTDPIDVALATYRAELAAVAPLAEAELDELVDHLRDAIAAEIAAGQPEASAIARALDRIGPAAALARECLRVRSGFAARLPAWRAWSAAAVIAVTTLVVWLRSGELGHLGARLTIGGGLDDGDSSTLWLIPVVVTALTAIAVLGLIRGRSLARIALLGYLAGSAVWIVDHWLHTHPRLYAYAVETRHMNLTLLVAMLGTLVAVVLLAPWRRRELSRPGWAVALAAAALATPLHSTMSVGWLTQIAVIYGALAVLGCALRARWGCALGLLTAITLAVIAAKTASHYLDPWGQTTTWVGFVLSPRFDAALSIAELGIVIASSLAAVLAGVLGWRRSRRGLGDPGALAA